MLDPDQLNVWYETRLVGHLWRDSRDRLGFVYDSKWVESGFPLSRSLPLQEGDFDPDTGIAHAWFSNLLPEGQARDRVARWLGIPDSDFALLREIGGDCAGALSLLPVEHDPQTDGDYQPLSEDQLYQLILQRGQAAYRRDDHQEAPPRLSLAGAQDKCPVLHDGTGIYLPQGAAASSHILKFEVPGYRHVPVYEAFLTDLARAVGLPTVDLTLQTIRDLRYLLITRFDRLRSGSQLVRLHQEDFCQIAGLRPSRKYETEGGPSLATIMNWIREVSEEPVADLQALLKWQIFNWLCGNSDGHAKNLAVVQVEVGADRWRLAPYFDLVCTRAFPDLDRRLALKVGGENDPGLINESHWRQLAREGGLQPAYVVRQVRQITERIREAVAPVKNNLQEQQGELPMLQRVELLINRQTN